MSSERTVKGISWVSRDLFIKPINAHIDPIKPVERAIITHGHADHARPGHRCVLATPQTIDIMQLRYGSNCADSFHPLGYGETININGLMLTLYPAGHILGSAQVLLEYRGERVVVTGDYKTTPDRTAQAFQPIACDTLITEATFGLPVFQHPDPRVEITKLLQSVQENPGCCHVVGAYALGKAQRLIRLIREAGCDAPVYLHGAQVKLCDYYATQGIVLGELRKALSADKASFRGSIVIAPPSALKDKWSRRLPDPVIACASGWMSVKQRAKQSLVELPLVISDHADWNELTAVIDACGASEVWVTHGREDALVHWCRTRGLNAQPLSLQGREEEIEA